MGLKLFMGLKYNAATSLEELGSTKTYMLVPAFLQIEGTLPYLHTWNFFASFLLTKRGILPPCLPIYTMVHGAS